MNLKPTQKIMLQRATPQELYNLREAIDLMFHIPEGWQVRKTCEYDERTLTLEEIETKWTINAATGQVINKKSGKELKSLTGNATDRRVRLSFYADDGTHQGIARSHLVWLKFHGTWPTRGLVIDHVDQNPMNDRISNLREVSQSKNLENITSKKLKLDSHGNLLPRGIAQHRKQYKFEFELTDSFLTRTLNNQGPRILISTYSLEETYALHVLKQLSNDYDDFLSKLILDPEDIQRIEELRVGINSKVGYTIHPLGVRQPFEQDFQQYVDDYAVLYGNTSPTIH